MTDWCWLLLQVPILYLHGNHYTALKPSEQHIPTPSVTPSVDLPTNPVFKAPSLSENRRIKERMRVDSDFRERVKAWDTRRKRIEGRLDSHLGNERRSAARAWMKHMQKSEERHAVLALWEDANTLGRRWDVLSSEMSAESVLYHRPRM